MTAFEETEAKKKLEDYKMVQLALPFVLPETETNYSNTIELYDAVPKYHWGKSERVSGKFLDTLEREFKFRNQTFKVVISPARIKDKEGRYRDHFPGVREELVEDALRKLACDGQGVMLDDQAGVVFSLYQLQQELRRMGHTYSISELKDSILILAGSNMLLQADDGKAVVSSSLFETVGLQTRTDWLGSGQKTRCFVRFNLLVTRSIQNKTYRQLNYKACMTYKRSLARWLHKRMSHLFIQASFANTYHIQLSTILRDSGTRTYKRLRDNLKKVRESLEEMKEKGVIGNFEEEKILDGRKIMDVKFLIKPGLSFIRDMKKANALLKGERGGAYCRFLEHSTKAGGEEG